MEDLVGIGERYLFLLPFSAPPFSCNTKKSAITPFVAEAGVVVASVFVERGGYWIRNLFLHGPGPPSVG